MKMTLQESGVGLGYCRTDLITKETPVDTACHSLSVVSRYSGSSATKPASTSMPRCRSTP